MTDEMRREDRMRRLAARQGLSLVKSRCQAPEAPEFGTFMLVNTDTNTVVHTGLRSGFGLDLDAVENIVLNATSV
jgi:hypothetical protein